jgi:molybdenum cofactor biosynthesis protein B
MWFVKLRNKSEKASFMSETSRQHKEEAPKKLSFAVITISSSRSTALEARKKVIDESGDMIADLLKASGHVVFMRELVSDSRSHIDLAVKKALQSKYVDAVITCGGTGISPADITIETVYPLLDKELPGFGELFRSLSYSEIGSAAVMSRALAGVTRGKAVFCLPGSPQAVRLCLERLILPEVGHIVLHAHGK